MGLDQYAYVVDADSKVQIACWRKHNRLQGWMEDLAVRKKLVESADEFNCIDLELCIEDLERLEQDVITFDLPETDGFFFGSDSYGPHKSGYLHDEDMKFVVKAREALTNGFRVIYSCWW